MNSKVSVKFWSELDGLRADQTGPAFRYGEIERALAALHKVPAGARKTLQSRIKHFQRIGLAPAAPGRGHKVEYGIAGVLLWAVSLELSECALPPEQIKEVLNLNGPNIFHTFEGPVPDEDLIFVLQANFLEWHLRVDGSKMTGEGQTQSGIVTVSQIRDMIFKKWDVPRLIMINLTDLKRRLADALNIEWT